jgi:hypothetical protein
LEDDAVAVVDAVAVGRLIEVVIVEVGRPHHPKQERAAERASPDVHVDVRPGDLVTDVEVPLGRLRTTDPGRARAEHAAPQRAGRRVRRVPRRAPAAPARHEADVGQIVHQRQLATLVAAERRVGRHRQVLEHEQVLGVDHVAAGRHAVAVHVKEPLVARLSGRAGVRPAGRRNVLKPQVEVLGVDGGVGAEDVAMVAATRLVGVGADGRPDDRPPDELLTSGAGRLRQPSTR